MAAVRAAGADDKHRSALAAPWSVGRHGDCLDVLIDVDRFGVSCEALGLAVTVGLVKERGEKEEGRDKASEVELGLADFGFEVC